MSKNHQNHRRTNRLNQQSTSKVILKKKFNEEKQYYKTLNLYETLFLKESKIPELKKEFKIAESNIKKDFQLINHFFIRLRKSRGAFSTIFLALTSALFIVILA